MFNNTGLRYDAEVLLVKTTVESAVNNPSVHLGKYTDLLILFLFHFDLDSNYIYFKSMRTSSTTMKIWDIHETTSTFGLDECNIIPFLQVISGCDTISKMFGMDHPLFKRF